MFHSTSMQFLDLISAYKKERAGTSTRNDEEMSEVRQFIAEGSHEEFRTTNYISKTWHLSNHGLTMLMILGFGFLLFSLLYFNWKLPFDNSKDNLQGSITPFDSFLSHGYLERCGKCWQAYEGDSDPCIQDSWCSDTNRTGVSLIGTFRNIQFITSLLIQRPNATDSGRVTQVEVLIDNRYSVFGADNSGTFIIPVMAWALQIKVIVLRYESWPSMRIAAFTGNSTPENGVEEHDTFILLTSQRCGSHWIRSIFDRSTCSYLAGEVFMTWGKKKEHRRKELCEKWTAEKQQQAIEMWQTPKMPKFWRYEEDTCPRFKMNAFHANYSGKSILGFTWMLSHFEVDWEWLRRQDIRIIFVKRRNLLRQHISHMSVHDVHVDSTHSSETAKIVGNMRTRLNPKTVVQKLNQKHEANQLAAKNLLTMNAMIVDYEDLEDHFGAMFDFARGNSTTCKENDVQFRNSGETVKIHKGSVRDLLANFDEIESALKGTEYEFMLYS